MIQSERHSHRIYSKVMDVKVPLEQLPVSLGYYIPNPNPNPAAEFRIGQ